MEIIDEDVYITQVIYSRFGKVEILTFKERFIFMWQ